MMKYEAMNQAIIKGVGGPGNVKSVVHCATRLRFVLNDESKADDDAVKNIREHIPSETDGFCICLRPVAVSL